MSTGIFVFLLQSYIFLYGCSSTPARSIKDERYDLYASKCGSCHRLLPPQDYTQDQWRHYTNKYGQKMAFPQRQLILNYLQEHAVDSQNGQH